MEVWGVKNVVNCVIDLWGCEYRIMSKSEIKREVQK
jgi:hypothetical protein